VTLTLTLTVTLILTLTLTLTFLGLSLAVRYNNEGLLIGAGTRGDGLEGEDVTINMQVRVCVKGRVRVNVELGLRRIKERKFG
jgi:NAD-dependent DNA ligase